MPLLSFVVAKQEKTLSIRWVSTMSIVTSNKVKRALQVALKEALLVSIVAHYNQVNLYANVNLVLDKVV